MVVQCAVCDSTDPPYSCPRCNIKYCSLDCYKNHSSRCTDAFYQQGVQDELRLLTATPEDKKRMEEILFQLHQQQIEDLDDIEGNDEDGHHNDSDDEEEELVPGISMTRALLIAEGRLSIDDLTPEEHAAFQREISKESNINQDLNGIIHQATAVENTPSIYNLVQPWTPWWLTQEARDIVLTPAGTRLIEEISESVCCDQESSSKHDTILPDPPPAPLPPLASLSSKPPSPSLAFHLLDLIYVYCLTMRLFNGHCEEAAVDAAEMLMAASHIFFSTATGATQTESINNTMQTASCVLLDCIVHVCTPGSIGHSKIPREFAIGLLTDVEALLELGRCGVLLALMDISRLIDSALQAYKKTKNPEESSSRRRVLKAVQRKVVFFLSYSNDTADAVCSALAFSTRATYEEQIKTLNSTQERRSGLSPHS